MQLRGWMPAPSGAGAALLALPPAPQLAQLLQLHQPLPPEALCLCRAAGQGWVCVVRTMGGIQLGALQHKQAGTGAAPGSHCAPLPTHLSGGGRPPA